MRLSVGQMGFKIGPTGIVYWTRFALGIVAGVLCHLLKMKGSDGISLMVLIYLSSYFMVKYGWRYTEEELKGRNKSVLLGVGTYIFLWAATWIFLYTLYPYPIS